MRTTEILFESRAAVLKAEAETRLLDKQIELEKLRKSNDVTLMRQALEALESSRVLKADYLTLEIYEEIVKKRNSVIDNIRSYLGKK